MENHENIRQADFTVTPPLTEPVRKKNNLLPLILIVLLVAVGGLVAWIMFNPSIATDNAMIERTKATVGSKTMGLIVHINKSEDDFAQQGELLAQLDTAELDAQHRQAQANLDVTRQSADIANLTLDKMAADWSRARQQYSDHIISTESYQHAQKAWQAAQLDQNLAVKKIEIAQAQLDLVRASLANTRLVAPFDAVVAKKWLNEGDVLQPGQVVLTLYSRHEAWVTANFEETKIERIKPGQRVRIMVDAYPSQVFWGKVAKIGESTGNQFSLIPVNNAAGNFTKVTQRIPVRISLDEGTELLAAPARNFLPGMSVRVEIQP